MADLQDLQDTLAQQIQSEHWLKAYWRPCMGWLYMLICACDFVVFPMISMLLPISTKSSYIPWTSLTLQNGGFIHLSFGTILGIGSWTRSKEKMNIVNSATLLANSTNSTGN